MDNYKNEEVVVYVRNDNISFLGCGMALWIGKQISTGDNLFYCTPQILQNKGSKVHMEAEVTAIDPESKTVKVKLNGEEIEDHYDKLILATGSNPVTLNIPGKELENVQLVKLYQNAQSVINKIEEDPSIENVVVIGAGYIGVELAEAFQRLGKNVTLIDREEHILSGNFDPEYGDRMAENMKSNGIDIRLEESVLEFKGEKGKVSSVVTDKGTFPCEMVISAAGFTPNSSLGGEAFDRFKNGAYLVNKRFETSQKDVYAIGDCSTEYNNAIDDVDYIALATNAVRSGIVAAHNACGTDIESLGVQGSSAISIFGYNMVSAGLTVAAAKKQNIDVSYTDFEDTQLPAFMEIDNPKVNIRIVYRKDNRVIVGAQLASNYDISQQINLFSLAIQEKVTIDKLALLDIFFLPHFDQPYNYITMAALSAK